MWSKPADTPRIETTAPEGFRLAGRRLGCVLVHGLGSTPGCFQAFGAELARHGVEVHAVVLPGHGTQPEDLLHVRWEDWYETVATAIENMRRRCDLVFVVGQSLGGSLALRAAAHAPVDGVVTLAAIAFLKNWRLWFLPVLKPVLRWRRSPGNDIARSVVDQGSYDRLPLHAIEQLLELAAQVRIDLPAIHVPALVVHSVVDHVAPPQNADYIHKHIGSDHKELLRLHRSFHVISLDNDRDIVVDRCVRFLRSVGDTATAG